MEELVDGETMYFHYDADCLLICEMDGTGNAIRNYVYLNGEPVAMRVAGDWFWFLNDHLGTPRIMVDASGAVVWKAAYLPFGRAIVAQADVENNLRFPGQYFDEETGLHYNWHRYYDPGMGRYLRPDPIGLAGGVNLYAYASNDPINAIDFLGLFSESEKKDIRAAWRNTGSTAGMILGIVGGAGGGASTGPGSAVAIPAGAYAGAAVGAVVGGAAGQAAADFFLSMMEGHGGGLDSCEERDPSQDKRLTKGEIKKLKKSGYDAHDLKPEKQGSRYDLFKDRQGNIYVKPRGGLGMGDPTGININNL